jgi:DNA-binding GntR family transcriptional regulator
MERGPLLPSDDAETKLRERLATMASGEAFPSLTKLAYEYHVSTASVNKAMKRLKADGLVASRKGWATWKV